MVLLLVKYSFKAVLYPQCVFKKKLAATDRPQKHGGTFCEETTSLQANDITVTLLSPQHPCLMFLSAQIV